MALLLALFASKLPFRRCGWIEAHREREASAQRINAGHDRANDDVRDTGGRYDGNGIDRATHLFLPLGASRTSSRKNQKLKNATWRLEEPSDQQRPYEGKLLYRHGSPTNLTVKRGH